MPKVFVEQSMVIHAPAMKVWDVLTSTEMTKEWTKEFTMDGGLESEWKLGSDVLWKNKKGEVQVKGKVTLLDPPQKLRYSVQDVNFDYSNVEIKEDDGITYSLIEKQGSTSLFISQGDFGQIPEYKKYYDATVEIWKRVLPIIKQLSEK